MDISPGNYSYDAAGNLAFRTNNALAQSFMVNSVNELTTNTNGGTLTVVGSTATFAASVIVNGTNSADLNHDGTFAAPNMPLTTNYTAVAEDSYFRYATNAITVNVSTNVAFQYDANGNLTNDGLRSFAYDDENQLIQAWVTNQWMSQFTYDAKMRRRIRQEFTWSGSGWTQTNAVYYVYDGNLVVQERDINNLPTTTYTRGKDLSGSLEGAGGIGGLLARTSQQYTDAPLAGHTYYHADANGNVTILINSSQAIVAKYLYDAFGNVLSKSGLLADANVYQFSSKEKDANSGLVYYLYRFYDPNLQRWPNRDPIGEMGFETLHGDTESDIENTDANLYTALRNNINDHIDAYGLATIDQINKIKQEIQWAQSLRNAILAAQSGKGCPCLDSVDAYICGCFVSHPDNSADFASCVCQTSPDPTDCEKRARKVADPIYKWKNNIQKINNIIQKVNKALPKQ